MPSEGERCNPIVVHPKHDAPGWNTPGGRYEVYCARCGPEASVFADTYPAATIAAGQHTFNPGGVRWREADDIEHIDWTEARSQR